MKNTSLTLLIALMAILLSSCGNKKAPQPEANYLPDLKTEIPSELKNNAEIVEYITTTTDALNQMSKSLEDLYVKVRPYAKKEESELSTMEKLKITKHTLEFTSEIAKVAVKMALMEESYMLMSENLTDEELKALSAIQETFLSRIDELNTKYQNFNEIEIEQDNIEMTDSAEEAV